MTGGQSNTYLYSYNLAGYLTEARKNGAVTGSYTYDANGNRTGYSGIHGPASGIFDPQDRMLSYGDAAYTYTANGELLTKTDASGTTQYLYDVLGNLQKMTLPGGKVVEYVLDGQNRRIGKMVNGVLVRSWIYEDQLRPAAELDGAGNVVIRFVYGTKVNVPEYVVKDGTIYRIVMDHLGSPRLVLDVSTGSVVQRLDFDEYGVVLTDNNPGFAPFGFAGGLYDHETGLVRFGARDYDAGVGRWTCKDPIGFGGGTPNLFQYVMNNPINRSDVTGLVDAGRIQNALIEGQAEKGVKAKYPGCPDDLIKEVAKKVREEMSQAEFDRLVELTGTTANPFSKKLDKQKAQADIEQMKRDIANRAAEKSKELMDKLNECKLEPK